MTAALALFLALALQAVPEAKGNEKPPDPFPPSRLGVEWIGPSPVVVVARTISVRDAGLGAALLHVRVIERMRGQDVAVGDSLAVFTAGDHFAFGSEDLLFLRPFRESGRFEVVQRISVREGQYAAMVSITRRTIWLMEIEDPERRIDATIDLLLGLLRSRDTWTRRYGLEELRWMAEHRHAIFAQDRRERVRTAARASAHQDVKTGVVSVTRALAAKDSRLRIDEGLEQSDP
ncbi:MAG: hypothetical protein ACYTCU_11420 [Planctomycetota bacterium]|jgi:hypothetical protein